MSNDNISKEQQITKNCHIVPQFIIKEWTNEKVEIHEHKLLGEKKVVATRKGPEKIFSSKNHYENETELMLSKTENMLKKFVEKCKKNQRSKITQNDFKKYLEPTLLAGINRCRENKKVDRIRFGDYEIRIKFYSKNNTLILKDSFMKFEKYLYRVDKNMRSMDELERDGEFIEMIVQPLTPSILMIIYSKDHKKDKEKMKYINNMIKTVERANLLIMSTLELTVPKKQNGDISRAFVHRNGSEKEIIDSTIDMLKNMTKESDFSRIIIPQTHPFSKYYENKQ